MASPVADSYIGPSGGVVAGGRQYTSAFWRNLSPGWTEVVIPGEKAPSAILAYSGMALDEVGGKIYLFGGGHNDYGGNDVWELDIEARQAWVRHYSQTPIPSTESAENAAYVLSMVDNTLYPGAIVADGVPIRPIPRHTYYSVHWVKALGKFTVGGGSTYSGDMEWTWRDTPPWDGTDGVYYNDPRDLWLYDPISKTWDYKGSERLDPDYKVSTRGVYSEAHNKLFTPINNGNNCPVMWQYDIAENTWSLTGGGVLGPMASAWNFCMDPLRNRVILLINTLDDGIQVWAFALDTLTWSVLPQSGALPLGTDAQEGKALVYSPITDRMILITPDSNLKFYDFATGEWTTETESNPPGFAQAFTTWTFDTRRGVALLVYSAAYTVQVYAYKEAV